MYQLGGKMAQGIDNSLAFFKGPGPAGDIALVGKQGGPGKVTEWVNKHHAESSKFMNDKIQGLEASLAKGVGNPKNINVEEVTPPGSQNPVKVYTDGYAQVNKGKIDIYIRGKIKEPPNYAELKNRIKELQKLKKQNPSEFTKEMEKEFKAADKIVHNYERSKGMGELLDDARITDTAENNEMIAKPVLDAAKEVTSKNTKIRSYINVGNKPVIVESWWILDKSGTPYCSTIILIEVK